MPSVQFDCDVPCWLEYVLRIMPSLLIELQLVWLYEILVKTCLFHYPKEFRQLDKSYVINTESLLQLITNVKSELRALRLLCRFRNHYVHFSYYDITNLWKNCVKMQTVLSSIAQRYGVTLNWNKTVALDMM